MFLTSVIVQNSNYSLTNTMDKLTFNQNTPKEQYEELFKLNEGDVFEVSSEYETVLRRITEDYAPTDREFEVFPINPGTDLYTMYGPNHLVVTRNRLI